MSIYGAWSQAVDADGGAIGALPFSVVVPIGSAPHVTINGAPASRWRVDGAQPLDALVNDTAPPFIEANGAYVLYLAPKPILDEFYGVLSPDDTWTPPGSSTPVPSAVPDVGGSPITDHNPQTDAPLQPPDWLTRLENELGTVGKWLVVGGALVVALNVARFVPTPHYRES